MRFLLLLPKFLHSRLIPLTNSHSQVRQSSAFHPNLQTPPRSSYTMPKEKSPGLKILWLWTIGTTAILVTSVMRTRLRDLESAMNAQQQQQQQQQENQGASLSSTVVDTFPSSEGSEEDGKL